MAATNAYAAAAHSDRRRHLPWKLILTAAIFLPLACSLLLHLNFFDVMELRTEDLRYSLRGDGPVHPDLRIIEIDDHTIQTFGGAYPLPRYFHAALISGLHNAGIKNLGFDMVFRGNSVDPQNDRMFLAALLRYGQGTTVATFYQDLFQPGTALRPRAETPTNYRSSLIKLPDDQSTAPALVGGSPFFLPSNLSLSQAGFGHVNLLKQEAADGSIRHLPLVIAEHEGLLPSLALALWLQYRGLSIADLVLDDHKTQLQDTSQKLQLTLTPNGVREIAYAGDTERFAAARFSYADVLNSIRTGQPYSATQLQEIFAGKVVIVGLTAPSSLSLDHGATPYDSRSPLVYAHVNLLNNLLLAQNIERPNRWWEIALSCLLLVMAGAVGRRWRQALALSFFIGIALLLLVCAQYLFNELTVMVRVVPLLASFLLGNLILAATLFFGQDKERQILQDTFGAYVAPELLPKILRHAGKIELGGVNENVTVLFLDIRGFTAWAESLAAPQLVHELNDFLAEIIDVIFAHGGSVNKFLGDAVLATFGAPLTHNDDPLRAVNAALMMRDRLALHNRQRQSENKPIIRIGIGLATGPAIAGNIGNRKRLEYTVIGNVVNLASRLQTLSADGEILTDTATAAALKDSSLQVTDHGQHTLKGIAEAVTVFALAR